MKIFKDNAGKSWELSINIASIKRVKSALDVNLLKVLEEKNFLASLVEDIENFFNVIYILCKPQADAANIDEEQFAVSMVGKAFDSASDAFLVELADFFLARRMTSGWI